MKSFVLLVVLLLSVVVPPLGHGAHRRAASPPPQRGVPRRHPHPRPRPPRIIRSPQGPKVVKAVVPKAVAPNAAGTEE